jgi:hypothetical protein
MYDELAEKKFFNAYPLLVSFKRLKNTSNRFLFFSALQEVKEYWYTIRSWYTGGRGMTLHSVGQWCHLVSHDQ